MKNVASAEPDPLLLPILVGAIAIGVALRAYGVGTWELRGDELFTLSYAQTDPGKRGFFSFYYYVVAGLLPLFQNEILAVRLPAAVAGVFGLGAFFVFAREAVGHRSAILGTLVLSFSHHHVELSQFARYYSAVFMFAALNGWLFLVFVRTGSVASFVGSALAGIAATANHPAAALVFVATGGYALLGLIFRDLLPHASARKIVWVAGVVAVLGVYVIFPSDIVSAWVVDRRWDNQPWAMIPLLAFNHYTVPVFVAAGFGLWTLLTGDVPKVGLLATLAVASGLAVLAIANLFINFSLLYLTSIMPWFFLSLASVSGHIYERVRAESVCVALAMPAVLIAAQLPSLASHFLERRNISPQEAFALVADQAAPGDVVDGMFPQSVDLSHVVKAPYLAEPYDRTFDWKTHLDAYLEQDRTVWFVHELPRTGYAPAFEDWLVRHAERVYYRRAHRIDRRAVSMVVWKRSPVPKIR